MQRIIIMLFCVPMILASLYTSPSEGQIINGDFSDGLNGWYKDGDVNVEDGVAVLRTGVADWMTLLSTEFKVSGDRLTFRYSFETIWPDDIKYPDLESYHPDFFEMSLLTDGVKYYELLAEDPTGGFIPFSMDISDIPRGTYATVEFMLMDGDDRYFSVAKIDDISDPAEAVPEPGTLILLGGGLIGLFIYGRYNPFISSLLNNPPKSPFRKGGLSIPPFLKGGKGGLILIACIVQICSGGIAYGELREENVDDKTTLQFTSPLFNSRTNILTLNMTVTNVSDISIFTPLKVVITGISTPDVTIANPDGYTPEGLPFFDLTPYITDRDLSPGEITPSVKLSFYNPKRVKFRWDQNVYAYIDVPLDVGPVIFTICLVPGESPPVCESYDEALDIENPEFDRILQGPLPEMYLYEQVRVFADDYEGLPLKVTINGVEASFNETGFYYYRYLVLKDGLNTISMVATNEAGISATREITLNIDSIPPVINLIEPTGGIVVTAPEEVIMGTVDDPGVNKVTVIKDFIYRDEVPVVDGIFSKNITLSAGHNDIRIEASDIAGNSAYYNLDIIYVYSELGTIEGHISNDILGLPLAGATVTAITYLNEYRTTISGDDGSYRLGGVRSGDITLLVEREGYLPRRLKIFSAGGDTPYKQDVALIPVNTPGAFTLTGQVKDTGGRPLKGASVSVAGTTLTSLSDQNGIYIISGIPRTSFVVEAYLDMYEGASLSVNAGAYSSNTTILTYNFILKEIPVYIRIISPADGEYLPEDDAMVIGLIRSGDRDVGVRINGVLAQVYNGYFMANDVPLAAGVNNIIAEMIDPSGTLLTDSINVILADGYGSGARIHAQEAGIVPVEIPINIDVSSGTFFQDYSIEVTGPGATELISEGPLQHRLIITVPGIYTITFNGVDSAGNKYKNTSGFTGMARGDIEEILKSIWTGLKDYLKAGKVEDALSLFTPDTRGRYKEQFYLLGDRLSDIFSSMGDIQIVTLKDNVAKTRINEGEITHYVWFARDIYGLWKIHKF